MEWLKLKNFKDYIELKKEYKKINNLKNEIKIIFGNESLNLIKFNSWKNIFIGLSSLIKIVERQRYIVGLLETDNPDRAKIIGLTSEVLSTKKTKRKWYADISKVIHPDYNNNSKDCQRAMVELNSIYEELMKYEK
ncbi:MAG: hypothetical protein ACRC0F_01255 [Cetobacterium sp.]